MTYILSFLLLDLVVYVNHRLLHIIPDGRRFHALHHSDRHIDITTAVRHHPIEYLISAAVYGSVAVLMPTKAVAFHGTALFLTALWTHTKLRLPSLAERFAQWLVITPDLHLIHHSLEREHANSNFGGVLSVWDRLLNTLFVLPREEITLLRFGVRGINQYDASRPIAMFATPWRINSMYSDTHYLSPDEEIEVSTQFGSRKTRLRANFVRDGRIVASHIADYPGAPHQIGLHIVDFTRTFEEIAQVPMPRPLFRFEHRVAA